MKIVNGPIKKGKLILSIGLAVSVADVAKVTEETASNLISRVESSNKRVYRYFWHAERLSGRVYLDYPLSVLVELEVNNIETIGSLVWHIAKAYQRIYQEEEKTTIYRAIPGNERDTSKNRNRTNGVYGIWGHDIEDLTFETISIYDNGNIIVGLGS
jgi:hypothetical protein